MAWVLALVLALVLVEVQVQVLLLVLGRARTPGRPATLSPRQVFAERQAFCLFAFAGYRKLVVTSVHHPGA